MHTIVNKKTHVLKENKDVLYNGSDLINWHHCIDNFFHKNMCINFTSEQHIKSTFPSPFCNEMFAKTDLYFN